MECIAETLVEIPPSVDLLRPSKSEGKTVLGISATMQVFETSGASEDVLAPFCFLSSVFPGIRHFHGKRFLDIDNRASWTPRARRGSSVLALSASLHRSSTPSPQSAPLSLSEDKAHME
jgi:hypothetical protein